MALTDPLVMVYNVVGNAYVVTWRYPLGSLLCLSSPDVRVVALEHGQVDVVVNESVVARVGPYAESDEGLLRPARRWPSPAV